MRYIGCCCTDVGIEKTVNQDSLALRIANTYKGEILMAVVCDGMGGLNKGELASSTLIYDLTEWFEEYLPKYMSLDNFELNVLEKPLLNFLHNENLKIMEYASQHGIQMGSTCTLVMIFDNDMMIIHIGDTRVYCVANTIEQLTGDHSLVALEIKQGKLTVEQAEVDPRRNILIQCVGASKICEPDVIYRTVKNNEIYLICSDGFRHEVSNAELVNLYKQNIINRNKDLEDVTSSIISLVKERGETDNISCIALQIKE